MKTQVLNDLLGNLSLVNYVVGYIFVFIALILKWTWQTNDSIKNNKKTPEDWSWDFWWRDNAKPKILSAVQAVLVVFIVFRFSADYFNTVFTYAFALLVGLTLDHWVNNIKKMKTPLK